MSDVPDLLYVPLAPEQIQDLVAGTAVRIDIPASGEVSAAVVILRPASRAAQQTGDDS